VNRYAYDCERAARTEEEITQMNSMIKYHMDSDVTVFHDKEANRKFVKQMTEDSGFRPFIRNLIAPKDYQDSIGIRCDESP